ncbi:TolC family protein [Thermodesulfobacteriota bacterium]
MDSFKNANSAVFAVILSLLLVGLGLSDGEAKKRSRKQQSPATTRLSLPQAVGIALNRNLRMSDARLEISENEAKSREAYSDLFPSLDVQYVATGNRYRQPGTVQGFASAHNSRWTTRFNPAFGVFSPTFTPDYPYRIDPYRTFTMVATITQPVYTGGRLLSNYKYARLGVDYSTIQFAVDRQDLTLDVNQAYYQMMLAQRLQKVADQSIRALEALKNQTIEFYKAGVVPKVDVLSTEGQLAQARIQKTQATSDIERYRSQLNWLLRYPQETPTEIVDDLRHVPNRYAIPGIYSVAAGNRLEIRQANITVEQALSLVKASQANLLPSLAVQVSGTRINDDWNTFDREAINEWSVQGVLTWTLDMFRNRETVKERRASEARAFVAREQLVEQIMQEVKEAYIDMKRAETDIGDTRKAVEFRKENFRINQERYKEQVATYIEVLDAQRELARAEGEHYTALIQYRINAAVLERRMGILE